LECFKVAKFANIAVMQIRKDDSRNCVMKVLFGMQQGKGRHCCCVVLLEGERNGTGNGVRIAK
jgi:hypothetical protein